MVTLEELEERVNGGKYAVLGELWKKHLATCGGSNGYGEDINKDTPEYKRTLDAFEEVYRPMRMEVNRICKEYGLAFIFTYQFPFVKFSRPFATWEDIAPKGHEVIIND